MSGTLYRCFDASGQLLYVGCSLTWPTRLYQHQREKPWWEDVTQVGLEHFATREEAAEAENAAIQSEAPKHNRRGTQRPIREAELAARRERRESEQAQRFREMDETYQPSGLHCTNCGGGRTTRIQKGTSLEDAECRSCGCKALSAGEAQAA